ncbi:type I restriction-modification enzyme R subunit C-terminal domain-containing protein [Methanosarcina mazei]|uniref:type I restriction-modification enzyme R subunit C-terminal domain-containing protein n=1 Tax=Methanosarcina mazei TaxID=2209 RepID=UPI002E137501|nr:type I restriction-modification enzyme R subunit C-terminal domain-containing protein [Methanosarcina mazei]
MIKDAFQTYIIGNNKHYSSDQLNFILTLQTVFLKKKHIEYSTLWLPPFTNFGTTAPFPMFTQEELNSFIDICKGVEKDIFM